MAYTVECWTTSAASSERRILGQYGDQAAGEFWDQLGVDQNAWSRWHAELSSGRDCVPLSDYPQLSKLASADEGKIRFSDQKLQDLHEEFQCAIGRVHSHGAQSLLALLRDGVNLALERNGELVVHPFGIPPTAANLSS